MDVFDLQAKLSIDTSDFDNAIESALANMKKLSKAFESAGNVQTGYAQKIGSATKANEESAESLSTLSDRLRGLSKLGTPLDGLFNAALKASEGFKNLHDKIDKVRHPISTMRDAISSAADKFKYAGTTMTDWQSKLDSAKKKVDDLSEAYNKSAKETGENSEETKKLANELQKAISAMNRAESDLDGYKEQVEETAEEEKKAEKETGKFADALKNVGSKAVSAVAGLAKISAAALAVAGAAVGKLAKQSLDAYANYEQLVGGVETLFGAQGMSVEQYAESVGKSVSAVQEKYDSLMAAQKTVLDNASTAFYRAGLDQNQYIDQVTSFSASLIQSLGGDTEKAASVADRAIVDMADNANKMGTAMDSIQNAYQGFAKQNYTMLDNLKLGYGGTKNEMERLLADAEKLSGIHYEIGNFADMVEAIHVIQENIGITGTTSKEAAATIQGSTAAMGAAWRNLVANLARDDADIDSLINTLVSSIETAAQNIIPRLEKILGGIADLITKLAPLIAKKLPPLISSLVPKLISAATQILTALTSALPMLLDALLPPLIDGVVQVIQALVQQLPAILQVLSNAMPMVIDAILVVLPLLVNAGMQILLQLADGIAKAIPTLIPAIVDVVLQIVDTIIDNLDMLIDAAIAIMIALSDALTNEETLDKLIRAVPNIITKIVDILVEKAPELIIAAVEIIATLAGALLDNIGEIGEAAGEIVYEIIRGIDAVIGELFSMLAGIGEELGYQIFDWWHGVKNWLVNAWNTFVSWWNGVFEALGQWVFDKLQNTKDRIKLVLDTIKAIFSTIWEAISGKTKEIWNGIRDFIGLIMGAIKEKIDKVKEIKDTFIEAFQTAVNYIKELPAKALQWGKDLIDNFVGGIKAKAQAVVDGVKGVASSIKSFLGFSEPEKGPLSNFHTFAPDMMKLFASGIDKGKVDVLSSVKSFADDIAGYMAMDSYNVGTNYSSSVSRQEAVATAGISYAGATININISGADTKNPRALAERIAEELATLTSDNSSRIGAWAL